MVRPHFDGDPESPAGGVKLKPAPRNLASRYSVPFVTGLETGGETHPWPVSAVQPHKVGIFAPNPPKTAASVRLATEEARRYVNRHAWNATGRWGIRPEPCPTRTIPGHPRL